MKKSLFIFLIIAVLPFLLSVTPKEDLAQKFEFYKVDLGKQNIRMFWKDDKGKIYQSFESLKKDLSEKNQELVFAMNGGMYQVDRSPLGLYIENKKELRPVNKKKGEGNFYLKPNGIFYITSAGKAGVIQTERFKNEDIEYATQSGPMLVINGRIHHAFNKESKNVHIRNGVGVNEKGEVFFLISKERVTFYEMALYFKEQLKCPNALYLDGFVSRMYLPQKQWNDLGGEFGVIIGEVK